jgi:hypothetical protein
MRFKPTRIVAAIAVIGAVAAGGAAFTAGTGQPTTQAVGYGATSVTGGTVTGITYQLNSAGTDITSVTVATTQDLLTANAGASAKVLLAFNGDGFASGGDAACVIQGGGLTTICTPTLLTTVASVTSEQIAITDGNTGDTFSG